MSNDIHTENTDVIYAGFWRRVYAWLNDVIAIGLVLFAINFAAMFSMYSDLFQPDSDSELTTTMRECGSAQTQCDELSQQCKVNSSNCEGVNEACGNAKLVCLATQASMEIAMKENNPIAYMLSNYLVWSLLVAVFYIFMWMRYMATPGKLMVKLRVVDATTHERIKLWQAIVRYIGYFLSTILFFVGHFWIMFDKRKQGFHDKLARTVVIEAPRK